MHTSRRKFLSGSAALAAAAVLPRASRADERTPNKPFRVMLNTSTISGQKVGIEKEVEIASKAGYDCIEPWLRELTEYKKQGKSLKDLGKKITDAGLSVESAIGFAEWIVNDDAKRAKGLENAARDMEMVLELGGKRIAAPPQGATNSTDVPVEKIADRYKALAEIGAKAGILPMAEVWGHSKTLTTLSETVRAAMLSGHPKAMVLPDVYHLYKGGSPFEDLLTLTPENFQVLHVNDYPRIAREKIVDSDRVYPGDGIAPYAQIFAALKKIGFVGMLSLELFNHEYWKQDALLVATTGIEKIRALVAKA